MSAEVVSDRLEERRTFFGKSLTRGRRLYTLQMLVLCFIPHAALIVQNCSYMAQLSASFDSSTYLYPEITRVLSLSEAMMVLQDERCAVADHLLSITRSADTDLAKLLQAISSSNRALETIPPSSLSNDHRSTLYHLREDAMSNTYFYGQDTFRRLSIYEAIIASNLVSLGEQVKSTTSALWRELSSCYELVTAREKLSLAYLDLQHLTTLESPAPHIMGRFLRHQSGGVEHLLSLVSYLKALEEDYGDVREVIDLYNASSRFNESSEVADIKNKGPEYMTQARSCLDRLRRFQHRFRNVVRKSAQHEVWMARGTLGVGIAALVLVVLLSPPLIVLIRNTMTTMQCFSTSIASSTQRLMAEKQKSDLLLSRMLPMPVLQRLRAQRTVPAEAFDAVTIFFSDIVGFTAISANSTPMEIINMLNMLYRLFDEKITHYNVYKVETIGDAYMAVSGLPERNGNKHVSEIADMALSLIRSLDGATVPHCPGDALRVRAGINTGPCVAGVVGATMPRYCLFGDTINTASRMESTGEAMKIHISDTTKKALDIIGGYKVESRGIRDIPGKGEMETFWLLGRVTENHRNSPQGLRLKDYGQDVLEMLIRS